LKAVAYREGKQVAADELRTAGKPARIELVADRTTLSPDANQVVILTATAVDEAGIRVPDASAEVQFSVTGPAQIVATDNGNNAEHSPFPLSRRALYGGRAIAILRGTSPSGKISVRASAAGMPDGVTQLTAVPADSAGLTRAF
jgi:beta-galactosidase